MKGLISFEYLFELDKNFRNILSAPKYDDFSITKFKIRIIGIHSEVTRELK